MDREEHIAVLKAATGKQSLEDALAWIAEGHALAPEADARAVLRSVVQLSPEGRDADRATKRIARMASKSEFDSARILIDIESVSWPERFRRALDLLAWKSPDRTLAGLTASSVVEARREDPFVIRALCAIAGVPYRDLAASADPELPADPDGDWTRIQTEAFFAEIDRIVRGEISTDVPGAAPAKALDLHPEGESPRGVKGWEGVEEKRRTGVSYEVLLAQREAGGAWLAHRNATSGKVGGIFAGQLCTELDARNLNYRRSSQVGGETSPGDIEHLVGHRGVGVVVMAASTTPAFGVVFSTARDGGTARSNAGRILEVPQQVRVPTAVVLSGPGWAQRNETATLARAYRGMIFTERHLGQLVDEIEQSVL